MDYLSSTTKSDLEHMLFDETAEPKALPLSLLAEITNGFSDKQKIGEGGFAVVYEGMLNNGKVAVKRMSNTYMHEKQFHREVECLMMVKHKNVVRFLGYCADTQGSMERYNGKFVMADVQQRFLCFEYLPKGSLDKYITDTSCELQWRYRYQIIEGICQGLHYLHVKKIVHLDLKPANILLDDNLMPKIADFGLSRCFNETQSRIFTQNIGGTLGYLAPEFGNGEITYKFDLYSLGVIIIEILTGKKGYHVVDTVVESWSKKLEKSQSDIQLKQVRVCIEIGIECTDSNPAKRPDTQNIMDRLDETGSMDGYLETGVFTLQQAKNAPNELHQDRPKAQRETSSEVLESWNKKLEKPLSDVELKQVRACTEIGIQCTDFNPVKRTQNIISRHNETESMDGYTEPGVITSQQAENALNELHQDRPKASEETSSEDLSYYRSSNLLLGQTQQEHVPTAVFLAVMKIVSVLGNEAAKAIISKLSYKVANLKELPVKVENIKEQLIMIGRVIRLIGMLQHTDEVVKVWISDVRKVAYHVEDIMDKYSYHVLQHQEDGFLKKSFTTGTHYVKVFSEIVDDVVVVEKEIQLVIMMKPSLLVSNPLTEMPLLQRQQCLCNLVSELVIEEDLVGIEDNRILLTGWLYSKETESTVITVSGMGGLGKSALVSNVYEREKTNFDAHAGIIVSQIYTVDDLLRKLLLFLTGYTVLPFTLGIDKMGMYDMMKEIQQRFENRKCLIVLDDVWEQEVYFQIHYALQNLQGSRIIITTPKDDVAMISSPTRRLQLQPLSQPDAFDLFCKRAFYQTKGHMCPKELETIATSIVDMCHGLPLAIVTIASMFSSRPQLDFCNQTYNQLGRVFPNNDHVRAILNLRYCYYDLSEDLRCCFLYCSLFPEDNPMSLDSLVRLWVSEGLVVGREKKTPEMVAEENIMELIRHNMLEIVENDELRRVKTCKIHAIVRDLAISVAKEERFASANDYDTMIQLDKGVRRLSLCEWEDQTALEVKLPHLRTVVSNGRISSSLGMLSSILSNSSYLTVLELQDSDVREVPTLIGRLFNLRYIGLRRTKVKSLPDCIENLSNLYTLDVKQTKIEKLPRGVIKLKKLWHLLADRYDEEKQTEFQHLIGVQAPEELSKLEELQTLETVKSSNGLAEQLKKLMQLRSVSIENISTVDCANLFATLSNMPFLSSLLLSARDELCLEALKPQSADLYRLIIRGRLAKGTLNCPIFLHHGRQLKYLALSWCDLGEDPLKMLAPHLLNLAYLELANMHSANTLVISEDHFPKVRTVVLKHMPDVKELNIIDGALPFIESLYITSLPKMNRVPQGIESLRHLKKLWLLDLHRNFRSIWVTNKMPQKFLHVPEVRI